MSYYEGRSEFYKTLSEDNKKVAHGHVDDATGDTRCSFFRMNDNDESLAGNVQMMHSPAVIHASYTARPILKDDSERVLITDELLFLVKPESGSADEIEGAYILAETVLQEFIQWMLNAYEEDGNCGPFMEIDLNMFSWEPEGPMLQDFYGMRLTIREEQKASQLTNFNASNWF